MFSSQNSDADNDQKKILVEEPPSVARSKRSWPSTFRSEATVSTESQPDGTQTDPSLAVRPKKSAKEKRSKVARTGSTVSKTTDLPSQRSRKEITAKTKNTEHVGHADTSKDAYQWKSDSDFLEIIEMLDIEQYVSVNITFYVY